MGCVFTFILEMRGVNYIVLFLLVKSIIQFENLGTYNLVITIQNVEYLIVVTISVQTIVNIW